MEIQPKLLRLLQEREYERLGENVTRQSKVRIIAATNRDLKKRVAEGTFREDLYFRLNVITVEMPPLRLRPADLNRFANHYASHFALQCGRTIEGFTEEAIACLHNHSWPGNLRELRNAIERAVIMASDARIKPCDLPSEVRQIPGSIAQDAGVKPGDPVSLEQLENQHIRQILSNTPSLVEAAQKLGIDQATLYRKRKKMGIG